MASVSWSGLKTSLSKVVHDDHSVPIAKPCILLELGTHIDVVKLYGHVKPADYSLLAARSFSSLESGAKEVSGLLQCEPLRAI